MAVPFSTGKYPRNASVMALSVWEEEGTMGSLCRHTAQTYGSDKARRRWQTTQCRGKRVSQRLCHQIRMPVRLPLFIITFGQEAGDTFGFKASSHGETHQFSVTFVCAFRFYFLVFGSQQVLEDLFVVLGINFLQSG